MILGSEGSPPPAFAPESSSPRTLLDLPDDEELAKRIRAAYAKGDNVAVQVVAAMGIERIMGIKTSTE